MKNQNAECDAALDDIRNETGEIDQVKLEVASGKWFGTDIRDPRMEEGYHDPKYFASLGDLTDENGKIDEVRMQELADHWCGTDIRDPRLTSPKD